MTQTLESIRRSLNLREHPHRPHSAHTLSLFMCVCARVRALPTCQVSIEHLLGKVLIAEH